MRDLNLENWDTYELRQLIHRATDELVRRRVEALQARNEAEVAALDAKRRLEGLLSGELEWPTDGRPRVLAG